MVNKLQPLKGKTKLKLYKIISNYYDEVKHKNFQFEQDPFAENAEGIGKVYHEVFSLMTFSQTKPHVKNMNIFYCDLCYTVIKNRDEKEIVDDQYENYETDYFNYSNFITPNHYIGIENDKDILRWRLRS